MFSRRAQYAIFGALLVFLHGCGSAIMMTSPAKWEAPGRDTATVFFLRNSTYYAHAVSFDVWDGEKLVGVLESGSYIPYDTTAGDHVFLTFYKGHSSYVKATLEAGKKYFVAGQIVPGRAILWPVTRKEVGKIEESARRIREMTPKMIRPEKEEEYVQMRRAETKAALDLYQAGKVKFFVLETADGE